MFIVAGLVCLLLGMIASLYPFPIVRFFGHMDWAERRFGPGGSYTAWRLIGAGLIVLAAIVLRYFV